MTEIKNAPACANGRLSPQRKGQVVFWQAAFGNGRRKAATIAIANDENGPPASSFALGHRRDAGRGLAVLSRPGPHGQCARATMTLPEWSVT